VIPRRLKAATRFVECGVGLGGASARSMKGLRQIRNLPGATNLKAFVDRTGIPACLGGQQRDAYVAQAHRTARSLAALRSSISVNPTCLVKLVRPRVEQSGVDKHR
jgi:hypothetical protein